VPRMAFRHSAQEREREEERGRIHIHTGFLRTLRPASTSFIAFAFVLLLLTVPENTVFHAPLHALTVPYRYKDAAGPRTVVLRPRKRFKVVY
jgi:p-aminobenzoyl-glutamate transporter AbgT